MIYIECICISSNSIHLFVLFQYVLFPSCRNESASMLIDIFLGQEFLLKASLARLAGAMTASDDQPGGIIFQDRLELPQKIHSCF
jgi:hypothetical protein